jgi:aldehyde:ferredoxin oxidoreductase
MENRAMSDIRGGYTGRTLRIDLTAQKVTVEETPDGAMWLGSRGWNALVAWREVPPGTGPYDPENRLVFSAGPLVGTGAPTAGRTTISTIGPRGYPEPMWTWASMGGYWGAELKYAGYDSLIVQGQASAPCYLLIEDDKVTLEDASDLWGLGVYDTQMKLKERHGKEHQIATIGPAGENRVRFASIIHRLNNAVGNGGFGGVMGAKGLKAIVVRGTRGVPIADPQGFLDAVRYVWNLTRGGISCIGRPDVGYPIVACTHGCSVKCWTRIRPVNGAFGSPLKQAMTTCVDGAWTFGSHPAYEGTSISGEHMYIPRPPGLGEEAGLDLVNLTSDLGMTGWVYDTWYRYLAALKNLGYTEVLGEPLDLENPLWWRDWLLRVAYRQGTGDDYAEGFPRFYEKHHIGPESLAELIGSAGSRGHDWHRDGRAMEVHPSPFWEYAALLYAVTTRDVTPSTHGFFFLNPFARRGTPQGVDETISEKVQELAERVYGSRRAVFQGDEYIEVVTAFHQHRSVIKDSVSVCDWVFPVLRKTYETPEEAEADTGSIYGDTSAEAVMYRPCTGIDMDINEMERIAERIVNLERAVDVRNFGRCREVDEMVIPHFQWPEKCDRTHISEDAHEFRALLDRYYDLRGWDKTTGWPTREKLEELGLSDVADGLGV